MTIAWVGDGNNVCHSLMIASAKMGMKMKIATPEGYEPDPTILKYAEENSEISGQIILLNDPIEAVKGVADYIRGLGVKLRVLLNFLNFSFGDDSQKCIGPDLIALAAALLG